MCCYIQVKACFDSLHLPVLLHFHSSQPYKVTGGFSHPVDIISSLLHTLSSPCHSDKLQAVCWVEPNRFIPIHQSCWQIKARLVSNNFLCMCGNSNCSTITLEIPRVTLCSHHLHTGIHLHSQVQNTHQAFCNLTDFFTSQSLKFVAPTLTLKS